MFVGKKNRQSFIFFCGGMFGEISYFFIRPVVPFCGGFWYNKTMTFNPD